MRYELDDVIVWDSSKTFLELLNFESIVEIRQVGGVLDNMEAECLIDTTHMHDEVELLEEEIDWAYHANFENGKEYVIKDLYQFLSDLLYNDIERLCELLGIDDPDECIADNYIYEEYC